jgi:pimeloyl-ACP methyl ester carboxylesterase
MLPQDFHFSSARRSRRGEIQHRSLDADPRTKFLLYEPETTARRAPVLVTVHGISRNAREQVELFSPFADAYGVVLLAPIFDDAVFGKYQQLASKRPGTLRSGDALRQMLDEVGRQTSVDADRSYLFGYSGGGQFAHRFAMAFPDRVKSAVIGSAGWYTLPDSELLYPFGIADNPRISGLTFEPDRFLKTPMHVFVGPRDASRNGALRKSEKLDVLQGQNRIERGKRWVTAMQEAAASLAIAHADFRFELLSGGRHSFAKAMRQYGLGEATFDAFALAPIVTG